MRQIETPLLGAVLLPGSLGPMGNVPMPEDGPPSGPTRSRRGPRVAADETPTDTLETVPDATEPIGIARARRGEPAAEPR